MLKSPNTQKYKLLSKTNKQQREKLPKSNFSVVTLPPKMASAELNLWQQILRESSVRSKLPTASLLVAGDPESGKTALLSRLAGTTAKEPSSQQQVDTLLAYATVNVMDPKAKDSGGGDASGTSESCMDCLCGCIG